MALTKFDPFRELMDLQHRINRLFGEISRGEREGIAHTAWSPSVDIWERPDALFIEVELPGLNRENVSVRVENDVLTIEGERKLTHEEEPENYHRIERSYGAFSRSFPIPSNVHVEKIEAEFKEGVLCVRLPKKDEAKPKQLEVRVK